MPCSAHTLSVFLCPQLWHLSLPRVRGTRVAAAPSGSCRFPSLGCHLPTSSQSLLLLTSHLNLRMAQPILSSPESFSPAVWVWQGVLWKVYSEDHPLSKGHSLSSFPSYFGPPVIIHVSTWVFGILLLNILYFTMNASSEICFIVFPEI